MARFRRRQEVVEAPEPDPVFPVPARFNFTRDIVEAAALEDSNRHALTFVDREGIIDRRTFREVADDASRWAAYFRSRGLVAGDRVLVFVGKTPAWHSIMLGALKTGIVTVPCSEMLRAGDIGFRLSHSGAKHVVTDSERAPVLEQIETEAGIVEDLKTELRAYPTDQPTHDTGAEDIAFILYTSGTTKEPKGVVHSHGYTWTKRLQAKHWLTARPGDLVWCTAGTGWAKSIWNVLLGPWSCGAEIAIHEGGFDAEERFDLIERLGVTVLCQAPTEYRLMAKLPELERFYLGSVRHAVSAGEPLNPEVIEAFQVAFGLTIYDGYGQTENTLLVANVPSADVKPGSMGRPTPGHEVSVIDDEGQEQPVGVEGDIALRGRPPSLFLRYWEAPEETAAVFRGEWYLTGDRGTRDEDGDLWFTARADDVILSSAYRIGPFEVESALLEHPAVLESAVVGKPDADRGSLVKAFVVLREGYEHSSELALELQDHVKEVTAPYKYPREIEFVSELPKTSSGKIRRVDLRDRELGMTPPAPPPGALEPDPEPEIGVAVAAATEEEDARLAAAEAAAVAALAAEQERAREEERAAEQARRDREEAERAVEARAREADEQRRADETRRLESERAAEQALREREEAERAVEARAREADEQRRADETRRLEAERAAEQALREREETERAVEARAREADEQRRADETRRLEAERAAAEVAAAAAARQAEARQAEVERSAAGDDAHAHAASATPEAREQGKDDERRRRDEQKAAAEQARRDEAAEKRAAKERAKEEAKQRKIDERRRREEEKAAAEQARRDEAEAKRAAEIRAREEAEQRKIDEKRRREEEKAAAEQARRDEAEAKRAAEIRAREEAEQRKIDEKRRREEEKAAAEQARRDEAEAKRAAQTAAAEAARREEDERHKAVATPRAPIPAVPAPEDEGAEGDEHISSELIARLRAYGLGDSSEDALKDEE